MSKHVSRFAHFIEINPELTVVWNALSLGCVILDRDTAHRLVQMRDQPSSEQTIAELETSENGQVVIAELCKHRLLFNNDEDVDNQDYARVQDELRHRRIGILYLLLTESCNLKCRYCFVATSVTGARQGKHMDTGTAERALRTFAQALKEGCSVDEPQVILYGGEPTLNVQVLGFAIDLINEMKTNGELPRTTSITINTNGTNITDEVVAILKRAERLNVAISVDGPEKIHDKARPNRGNRGSFKQVMAGYRKLRKHDIEAGLCCTVSAFNVQQLPEIARWFIEDLKIRSLGFNIMIENPGAKESRGDLLAYAQAASEGLIECFRLFRKYGVHEDRVMRKVEAFADGTIYFYDCGGCGQQIVVTPDSRVGVCQGYWGGDHFVDLDDSFNPLTHPIWEEWRGRSPLAMKQCVDCIALSLCGGGCPYNAEQQHGTIWGLDESFCVHAKMTVLFLIRDMVEQMLATNNR